MFISYIIIATVRLVLLVLRLCMLARALFSFFPAEDNPIIAMLTFVTEPIIYPVRVVCDKLGLGDGMPVDVPFFIAFIILTVISAAI